MSAKERPLPQQTDAEQAVLGAMLIDPQAVPKVVEILEAEDFYRPNHRVIYQQMADLFEASQPVDLVTVTAALKGAQRLDAVGGAAYLAELQDAVPTAANVTYHAAIVSDRALRRSLIEAGTDIVRRGYEGDEESATLMDAAEERIFRLSQKRGRHAYVPLRRVLTETFQHIEELYKHPGVTGIPSGFSEFDRLTSGFQNADLTVIAARPSMGKTAFCLNIARFAALEAHVPTVLFSLEMSREQLALRLLCSEANMDLQKIRRGEVDRDEWPVLSAALGRLGDAPIFIDDSPSLTALDIRARSRRLKAEHNVGLVIIDYLQLMQGGARSENRQQEISQISRSLKALAREVSVPVIALSQLSRAVESRQDRRPMLSDLRESGAIEQDADVVGFIYRDDYYNAESEEPGVVEVILSKQRNGPTGTVRLHFRKETGRFYSLDEAHAGAERD